MIPDDNGNDISALKQRASKILDDINTLLGMPDLAEDAVNEEEHILQLVQQTLTNLGLTIPTAGKNGGTGGISGGLLGMIAGIAPGDAEDVQVVFEQKAAEAVTHSLEQHIQPKIGEIDAKRASALADIGKAVSGVAAEERAALGAIQAAKEDALKAIRAAAPQFQTADSPAIERPPRHVSVTEE